MAIELGPPGRARLLDPFGGRRDLTKRTLRFLHPRSPCDDPTRAFRAVRYANRPGFRVAPDSKGAIRLAIAEGAFDAVSGDRLRRQLELVFAEPDPAGAVARMRGLGLVRVVAAGLASDNRTLARLRRAEALVKEGRAQRSGLLFLLVWAAGLRRRELGALAGRLALTGAPARSVREWKRTCRLLPRLRTERRRSRIRRLVSGLSAAEIGALAAGLDRRQAARLCDTAFHPIRLSIGGRDLVLAGVPAGPSLGRALTATLEAREDGMIGPGEELDFALRRARGRDPLP
jgi:tRNA nucleotidyltransferase (CCA-adding enzyme)